MDLFLVHDSTQPRKRAAAAGKPRGSMPEKRQQNDDGNGHAKQPQQNGTHKTSLNNVLRAGRSIQARSIVPGARGSGGGGATGSMTSGSLRGRFGSSGGSSGGGLLGKAGSSGAGSSPPPGSRCMDWDIVWSPQAAPSAPPALSANRIPGPCRQQQKSPLARAFVRAASKIAQGLIRICSWRP